LVAVKAAVDVGVVSKNCRKPEWVLPCPGSGDARIARMVDKAAYCVDGGFAEYDSLGRMQRENREEPQVFFGTGSEAMPGAMCD
jgi:hypothetical protein